MSLECNCPECSRPQMNEMISTCIMCYTEGCDSSEATCIP